MIMHKARFRLTATSETAPMTVPDQKILQSGLFTTECFTQSLVINQCNGGI